MEQGRSRNLVEFNIKALFEGIDMMSLPCSDNVWMIHDDSEKTNPVGISTKAEPLNASQTDSSCQHHFPLLACTPCLPLG
jgi:hypothetical protein